jgi:hypothetical protein
MKMPSIAKSLMCGLGFMAATSVTNDAKAQGNELRAEFGLTTHQISDLNYHQTGPYARAQIVWNGDNGHKGGVYFISEALWRYQTIGYKYGFSYSSPQGSGFSVGAGYSNLLRNIDLKFGARARTQLGPFKPYIDAKAKIPLGYNDTSSLGAEATAGFTLNMKELFDGPGRANGNHVYVSADATLGAQLTRRYLNPNDPNSPFKRVPGPYSGVNFGIGFAF